MNTALQQAIAAGLIKPAEPEQKAQRPTLSDYRPGAYITALQASAILQRRLNDTRRILARHGLPCFRQTGSNSLLWNRTSVQRLVPLLTPRQLPPGNWLSAAQCAEKLACSPSTITRLGLAGKMRYSVILVQNPAGNGAHKAKYYRAEDVNHLAATGTARQRKPKQK